MRMHMHTYTHTLMHMHMHTHTHVHTHAYAHAHAHARAHSHAHITFSHTHPNAHRTHAHAHTHAHTYKYNPWCGVFVAYNRRGSHIVVALTPRATLERTSPHITTCQTRYSSYFSIRPCPTRARTLPPLSSRSRRPRRTKSKCSVARLKLSKVCACLQMAAYWVKQGYACVSAWC